MLLLTKFVSQRLEGFFISLRFIQNDSWKLFADAQPLGNDFVEAAVWQVAGEQPIGK